MTFAQGRPRPQIGARLSVARGAGAVLVIFGAMTMLAWRMKWAALVQFAPGVVPMQFNTALTFFLSGLCLCLARRRDTAVYAMAAFILAFAGLSAAQYASGRDFGIDRLFMEPFLQVRTAYPGRMAPNTAIYFIIFASALLCRRFPWKPETHFNIKIFAGAALLLLGSIALAGYLADVEAAYSWWGLSDMAPQTAAAFVFCGFGLWDLARASRDRLDGGIYQLGPAYAALCGIVLTLLIAQGVLSSGGRNAGEAVQAEAARAADLSSLAFRRDTNALARMTRRLSFPNLPPRVWKGDAESHLADNPAFRALALLDADCRPLDVTGGSPGFWRDLHIDCAALKRGRQAVARPEGLPASALVFCLPLHGGGASFLGVVYDVGKAMEAVLRPRPHAAFRYEVLDEAGTRVFSPSANDADAPWGITRTAKAHFAGKTWTLRVALESAGNRESGLVLLIVLFGSALSLLLANLLRQATRIGRYRAELENILDNIVDGLITIDDKGIVQSLNKAATRIFGYPAGEVTGRNISMLMPPNYAAHHDRYLSNYLGTGERKIIGIGREVEGQRKDGRIFPMDLSVAEAPAVGQGPRLFIGIVRDVTDRKAAEDALKRSHAELEQIAYVASHDLKAPLRGIDNLACWIAEDLEGVMTEDARGKLALLRSRVSRLETLLSDMLSYSRAGRATGTPEKIDTGELVRQVALPLAADGKFDMRIADGMPSVLSPRTPLEQVFSNIISNAIKHHDRGTGTIAIGGEPQGPFIEFSVSDDGPGIPPEFHERAFQMFQTLQPRDVREGSGLGMAIIRKLVEGQGGKVWVVSDPAVKRGTDVRFLWRKTAAH